MEAMATKMMKKEMAKLDLPEVPEFLEILSASGVRLWACKLAADMFKYKKEDLYEEIEAIITVGDFYARGSEPGTQMLFI
jgi:peroxiredoxin family protein